MNIEEITKIFHETDSKWEGDNAYQGLQILSKYTSNLIQGADHDIIYSAGVEEMIEAGITREDVEKLAKLNWTLHEGEDFACFV